MKLGQRYIITSGAYSDLQIIDSFVALKTFSFDAVLKAWLEEHGDRTHSDESQFDWGKASDNVFLAYLRKQGFVRDEPLNKVHLHDYGTPEVAPANDADDDPKPQAVRRGGRQRKQAPR